MPSLTRDSAAGCRAFGLPDHTFVSQAERLLAGGAPADVLPRVTAASWVQV